MHIQRVTGTVYEEIQNLTCVLLRPEILEMKAFKEFFKQRMKKTIMEDVLKYVLL